jgi:transcription elongation GreA/GreB family factor
MDGLFKQEWGQACAVRENFSRGVVALRAAGFFRKPISGGDSAGRFVSDARRMDKQALRQAILFALENELTLIAEAANTARDEATNEESRAEDRFDMRSQSAAYLAAGQAKLAGELQAAIAAYRSMPLRAFDVGEPVAIGALVTLETKGKRTLYFFGPQHGGIEVKVGEVPVTVVTGASPLGRQLLGRRIGDSVNLPGRSGTAVPHQVITVA